MYPLSDAPLCFDQMSGEDKVHVFHAHFAEAVQRRPSRRHLRYAYHAPQMTMSVQETVDSINPVITSNKNANSWVLVRK